MGLTHGIRNGSRLQSLCESLQSLLPRWLCRGAVFAFGGRWLTIRQTFRAYCAAQGRADLLSQWDAERNAPLTPDGVTFGSHKKLWWDCPKGHSWQAAVFSRTQGSTECPYCTGRKVIPGKTDLATAFPDLAEHWDRARNGALTPETVSPNANRKVWWRCEKGHSYCAIVAHRTRSHSECPYCTNHKVLAGFNDLATQAPQVAREWHPTLNGALGADPVTPGSHRKVWWQCAYGHVWKAAVDSRVGKQQKGCPICAGRTKCKTT